MVSTGSIPILPTRIGAIEPYVYNLAKNLAKTNIVDVFGVGSGTLQDGNLSIHTSPYVQSLQGSLIKRVDWRLAYYAPFNAYIFKSILGLHLKNPIDVLHIHEVYEGFAASLSKFLLGIPYVCSIHNEIRTSMPIRSCTRALAVSSYIQDSLIKGAKFDKDKVDILNVGVDIDACTVPLVTDAAKRRLNLDKQKVVLYVGRKCVEKGPQILIEALPKIIKQHPDVQAIFLGPDYAFGLKTQSYTAILIKRAERLGIQRNVLLKGHVSDEIKKLYYAAADVFVCPSIWQDPSPTVIKEALAFSKPVVATKVGGTSDIITHGYNGLLVPPADSDAIADSVNQLLSNRAYAEKLAFNGRKTVEQRYNFKAVTEECLKIYSQCI